MKEAHTLIREASLADISKLQTVLIQAQLSDDDILADRTRYWLAENVDGQPVGIVGLELGEADVLLRSAAVSPSLRGQGLGTSLVQGALDAAAGYRHVYLFSTGAGAYWRRLGWLRVPVSELVAALPHAPQVVRYEMLGWLPTEVAWRYDLDG